MKGSRSAVRTWAATSCVKALKCEVDLVDISCVSYAYYYVKLQEYFIPDAAIKYMTVHVSI